MTTGEIFALCGGKKEWAKLYSIFSKSIIDFKNSNLDCSERSFEILRVLSSQIIDDIEEAQYRASL